MYPLYNSHIYAEDACLDFISFGDIKTLYLDNIEHYGRQTEEQTLNIRTDELTSEGMRCLYRLVLTVPVAGEAEGRLQSVVWI